MPVCMYIKSVTVLSPAVHNSQLRMHCFYARCVHNVLCGHRRTLSETAKNLLHDPPWSSFMEEPLEQLAV